MEHNSTRSFWDWDGTFTGTIKLSLTWSKYDRENHVLVLYTAKREFSTLDSGEVRASEVDEKGELRDGERCRRRGQLKKQLQYPWERIERSIPLEQSDLRCNTQGLRVPNLTLSRGDSVPPDNAYPAWLIRVAYDPKFSKFFKKPFDYSSNEVSGTGAVGYLYSSNDMLYLRGDEDDYSLEDCPINSTKGTFIKDYQYASTETENLEKEKACSRSCTVVFCECAEIQADNRSKYHVEQVILGSKVTNPKMSLEIGRAKPVKWYNPFLRCIEEGLEQNEYWKKKYWGFWWHPKTEHVYGAVYMDHDPNIAEWVSPWVIKRTYLPPYDEADPKSQYPDCTEHPVVAFMCEDHLAMTCQP